MNYEQKVIEAESKVVAIDFDGVIHNNFLGFHDGTIYGEPIAGAPESIKKIFEMGYKIIVYTCKSHPDRPLVNNKTGTELVWDWLSEKGIGDYIEDVVWGKPHAVAYIDDKAIEFKSNWKEVIERII